RRPLRDEVARLAGAEVEPRLRGPLAGALDRPPVRVRVVAVARRPLPPRLGPPRRLARRHRRLPGLTPQGVPAGLGLDRREAVRPRRAVEERPQHGLGAGADEDEAVVAVVLRLVLARAEDPAAGVGAVEVARAQQARLGGAAARQQL